MRRFLMLAVLVAPLAAGELEDSVERFRSDAADERDAGSVAAHRIVRAHLKPLLDAMGDPDPEVARRARAIVLSLIPRQPNEPAPAATPVAGGRVIFVQGGAGRQQVMVNFVNGRINVVNGNAGNELNRFGALGHALPDGLARRQLRVPAGRGFAVTGVTVRSAAKKLGLLTHDIVVRVDGKPVLTAKQFKAALGEEKAWPKRKLRVLRGGKVVELPAR
ncbi:MAG: PDZ domain-containing protein [Planctomycetota bacterium]|nr:PDZ domain-containing protein [Planctomycetota bacterium]